MARFKKGLIPLGVHCSPDGEVNATPERIRHWANNFRKMKAAGIRIPVAWGHVGAALPLEDEDEFQMSLAKHNAGYALDMGVDPETGELYVEGDAPGVEIDDSGNLVHWVRLPDGREVKSAIAEVSAGINNWRDGRGKTWRDSVVHIALTPLPVVSGQRGFQKLSTRRSPAWLARATPDGTGQLLGKPMLLSTLSVAVASVPVGGLVYGKRLLPGGYRLSLLQLHELDRRAEGGDYNARTLLIRLGWVPDPQSGGHSKTGSLKWVGINDEYGNDAGKKPRYGNRPGAKPRVAGLVAKGEPVAPEHVHEHIDRAGQIEGHRIEPGTNAEASTRRAYKTLRTHHGPVGALHRLKELAEGDLKQLNHARDLAVSGATPAIRNRAEQKVAHHSQRLNGYRMMLKLHAEREAQGATAPAPVPAPAGKPEVKPEVPVATTAPTLPEEKKAGLKEKLKKKAAPKPAEAETPPAAPTEAPVVHHKPMGPEPGIDHPPVAAAQPEPEPEAQAEPPVPSPPKDIRKAGEELVEHLQQDAKKLAKKAPKRTGPGKPGGVGLKGDGERLVGLLKSGGVKAARQEFHKIVKDKNLEEWQINRLWNNVHNNLRREQPTVQETPPGAQETPREENLAPPSPAPQPEEPQEITAPEAKQESAQETPPSVSSTEPSAAPPMEEGSTNELTGEWEPAAAAEKVAELPAGDQRMEAVEELPPAVREEAATEAAKKGDEQTAELLKPPEVTPAGKPVAPVKPARKPREPKVKPTPADLAKDVPHASGGMPADKLKTLTEAADKAAGALTLPDFKQWAAAVGIPLVGKGRTKASQLADFKASIQRMWEAERTAEGKPPTPGAPVSETPVAESEKPASPPATDRYQPATMKIGDREVQGIGDGGLFVRESENGWTISHQPSARLLDRKGFPTREAAIAVMNQLNELADWKQGAKALQQQNGLGRAVARILREERDKSAEAGEPLTPEAKPEPEESLAGKIQKWDGQPIPDSRAGAKQSAATVVADLLRNEKFAGKLTPADVAATLHENGIVGEKQSGFDYQMEVRNPAALEKLLQVAKSGQHEGEPVTTYEQLARVAGTLARQKAEKSAPAGEKGGKLEEGGAGAEPEVGHENVEGESAGGPESGLRPGQSVGEHAGEAPAQVPPEPGHGTPEREGVRGLLGRDDLKRHEDSGVAGGPGDAAGRGGGVGEGSTAPEAAGGTGPGDAVGGGGGTGERHPGSQPLPQQPSREEETLAEPPAPENPTDLAAGNFRYTSRDFAKGGPKAKFRANIEAIKTLKAIRAEGRTQATPAEQAILSRYVGWGQFPAVFNTYYEDKTPWHEKNALREVLTPEEWDARFATDKWENERKLLQSLLSDDEWTAAKASTLNAHYTHPDIVDAHWKMAERLGFKGGRFLETSAGIGYYLGQMPSHLASRTHTSAVEIDGLTGGMAQMLYPRANVQVTGFEKYQSPDNFYDLIASNVPFGNWTLHEPRYNKHQALIHDHFFLKSADLCRPGGMVMHITSTGTMDKPDSAIRQELAKTCDLVAAIRFPGSAHKENAGTEVVTDLLILRKRLLGEEPAAGQNWMDVTTVPDPAGGEPIPVNRYFAEHPEQILGTLDRTGTMRAADQKNVSKTDDYEQRLAAAIERLPEGLIKTARAPAKRFSPEVMPAPGDVKQGGYKVKDGKIYVREGGALVEKGDIPAATLKRIQGQLEIRDAVRAVINDQLAKRDATASRQKLNEVYDAFVKKNGALSDNANKRAMRGDPDAPVLLALEDKYDSKTKKAVKSAMFTRNTVRSVEKVEHVESVGEALPLTLHEHGRLDIDHIARLTGRPKEQIEKEIVQSGVAFHDPSEGWKPADQYLSGNVRRKLALAKAAAANDPKFRANVEALEKVQPEDIDHTEISARLGSPWVPPTDVAAFAAHLLQGQASDFAINYLPHSGSWLAEYSKSGKWSLAHTNQAQAVWGTPRVGFEELFEAALNGRHIVVRDKIDEKTSVVNAQATDDANAKVAEMREKFNEWVWSDDARRRRLHRYYNDNFNNIRAIQYNGGHQAFPGMNPAVELRPHQKNFVWQVVTTGKGLAAHEVGTGKTNSMVASAMELRRLGLARKPAIACLKANVEAITRDALHLYPGAKIISTVDMFDAKKRKETISRIATGDYDMVILTHDHLNLLQMKPETIKRFIEEEVKELEAAKVAAYKQNPKKDNRVVKQLEDAKKKLMARLEKALDATKKDNAVFFEETGIDHIFVDECFPGRTLVATDQGMKTIGEIVEKRLSVKVLSCNRATQELEYKPVTSWFKRPLCRSLVRVTHEYGSFVCTANHKIWTEEDGYVQAGRLLPTHTLRVVPEGNRQHCDAQTAHSHGYAAVLQQDVLRSGAGHADHQELRVVPAAFHATGEGRRQEAAGLRQGVHGEVALAAEGVQGQGCRVHACGDDGREAADVRRAHAGEQPHVRPGHQREDAASAAGQDVSGAGRQWRIDGAADQAGGGAGLGSRVRHQHEGCAGTVQVAAQKLQGGPGASAHEDRRGDRRPHAQDEEVEVSRPAQDGGAICSRVVSVALHQRAGDERAIDGGDGDCFVYDIEVSGDHNYFADGVNVSNCHKFKSLPCYSKMQNLKGVPKTRSDRATAMLMRTRWLQEQNGGRGVVFATGTPVANTMPELYNMQRYLQPEDLKERGVEAFDAWAQTFGAVKNDMEFTVTGEYKPVSRFSEFVNLPELMQTAKLMMDVKRADRMKRDDGTPMLLRPKRKDHAVRSPDSPAMKKLMAELVERAEKIKKRKGKPMPGDDNMLVVCTDGRKGAIDMRLLDASAPDDPHSKANMCVKNVLELHKAHPGVTQLIFSDIGVNPSRKGEALPEMNMDEDEEEQEKKEAAAADVGDVVDTGKAGGFHLYKDIIDKLVKGGIPREKIADFSKLEGKKKDEAMEAMRQGEIVVGIGSTDKLGTGVNVQHKLAALHHLDVPWLPAAIEQRDGRGWRQGNLNDPTKPADQQKIDIHRYVAEGSLDQMFWQLIAKKAAFVNQTINEDPGRLGRVAKEIDTEEMSPEELMAYASGDTRVLEKVNLDEEVKKLRAAEGRHAREQANLRDQIRSTEEFKIPVWQREAKAKHRAAEIVAAHQEEGFKFSQKAGMFFTAAGIDPAKLNLEDKQDVAEAFRKLIDGVHFPQEPPAKVGTYKGMIVIARGQTVYLQHPETGQEYATGASIGSIEYVARNLATKADEDDRDVEKAKQDLEHVKGQIGKPFAKAEELKQKLARQQELEAHLSRKKLPSGHFEGDEVTLTNGHQVKLVGFNEDGTYRAERNGQTIDIEADLVPPKQKPEGEGGIKMSGLRLSTAARYRTKYLPAGYSLRLPQLLTLAERANAGDRQAVELLEKLGFVPA